MLLPHDWMGPVWPPCMSARLLCILSQTKACGEAGLRSFCCVIALLSCRHDALLQKLDAFLCRQAFDVKQVRAQISQEPFTICKLSLKKLYSRLFILEPGCLQTWGARYDSSHGHV